MASNFPKNTPFRHGKSSYHLPGTLGFTVVFHVRVLPTFPVPPAPRGGFHFPLLGTRKARGHSPQGRRPQGQVSRLPQPYPPHSRWDHCPQPQARPPPHPSFSLLLPRSLGGAGTVLTCPHSQRAHSLATSPHFVPDLKRCPLRSTKQVAACAITHSRPRIPPWSC